ncbi:MAG TPA: ATP-binding protein [Ideonella sp.]|uniref:ATP-binding protein n=1 Tax=Ideonella sp. TaxID=1929293 RepID=UPI002BA07B87|nr:ATP-binding protein [Ideonella sp.]HSI49839.1 ATP-binding protein [Ideonella sp.]
MKMTEWPLADVTQIAGARRHAQSLAQEAGFDPARAAAVALVATELSTNLIKHGGGGRLLVGHHDHSLHLLAMDKGQGMVDIAACMADGYSTAGTRGNGLGAVRRASAALHVASWPGQGTVIHARLPRDEPAASATSANATSASATSQQQLGAVMVAKHGETVCGDAWSVHEDGASRTVFVADGLGHGTQAAIASTEAVQVFQRHRTGGPVEIIEAVHAGLRHTRGAAVAAARVQWGSGTTVFAGLGNIAGTVWGPGGQMRRMVSHNGTAGHNARKVQGFEYPSADGLLIMHSDGIGSSWSLEPYPGLSRQHPMLVAGVLYRDFARGHDDATIVVVKTGRR